MQQPSTLHSHLKASKSGHTLRVHSSRERNSSHDLLLSTQSHRCSSLIQVQKVSALGHLEAVQTSASVKDLHAGGSTTTWQSHRCSWSNHLQLEEGLSMQVLDSQSLKVVKSLQLVGLFEGQSHLPIVASQGLGKNLHLLDGSSGQT